MIAILHKIWAGYERAMIRAGRERARQTLLRASDRTLADAGFSRERLEAGIGAWPWRGEADDDALAAAMRLDGARRAAERRAVRELDTYSDAELAELGIVRADIARAVREGRVGIELESGHEDGDRRRAA